MKIPDEYACGSKPLDDKREELAFALFNFNVQVAIDTVEEKGFIEMLKLTKVDDKEKNRMKLELIMFNLFTTSKWIMNNYKENGAELLDRLHFHFKKAFSDNDWVFGEVVAERHITYNNALANNAGAGPMFWLGREATLHILGKDEKNVDSGVLIAASLTFAGNFSSVAKGINTMVKGY